MSIVRWISGCSALALTVVGCSSPVTRYYVLEAPVPPARAAAGPSGGAESAACRVQVGALPVPAAVDRPQLVLREAPNRVAILEQARWAEPLREAAPRLLEDALRRYTSAGTILLGQHAAQTDPANVQVTGEFLRFELGGRGATVTLHAMLVDPVSHRTVDQSLSAEEPALGSDPAALVGAASRAVDRIGGDLARLVATVCGGA